MARHDHAYSPALPSLGRRSPKDLPPIQTSFAPPPQNPKRNRLRSVQPPAHVVAPAPQPKMERRQSKMSLFNLFSKPKVEKLRGYTEDGMPDLARRPPSPSRRKQASAAQPAPQILDFQVPPKAISTLIGSTTIAPPIPLRESSRRNLSHRESRLNLSQQPSQSWEPPPLFHAHAQALKHAFLPALTYSADSILRAQKSKRNSLLQNFRDSKIDLTLENHETGSSKASVDRSSRRFSSQSFTGSGWTRKIFVLVPAGILLQYAGDGPPDRQPEKVLQLEKDSAAFASDAIPGRHWVLQVSQVVNSEDSEILKSRSFLGRFKIQSSSTRKLTGNMLLVMESPDDMNSWMMAIRQEIEILGGKKSRSDTRLEQPAEEFEMDPDFHVFSTSKYGNHRITAKTPFAMSPIEDVPSTPAIVTSQWNQKGNEAEPKKPEIEIVQPNVTDNASFKSPRHSMQRPPSDRTSTATFLSSGEQQLNQLRNGSRESNISSNTVATSQASSPESLHSPPPKPAEQEARRSSVASKAPYTSPTYSSNSWRRSMQTLPKTDEYSIFPKESAPRGKRVPSRSDGTATRPAEPPSTPPSESPPSSGRRSLSRTPPKTVPEPKSPSPRHECDVSPANTTRTIRPVRSSPGSKIQTGISEVPVTPSLEQTPNPEQTPSPEQTPPKPSLIRPLRSVTALNENPPRRTSEPKLPRRDSAVPMRLPIRPSLPILDTSVAAKPVLPAARPTFLSSPSPKTPDPAFTVPTSTLAAVPKQSEPSSLKRPTTVQVRANPAPFLAAVRPMTRAPAPDHQSLAPDHNSPPRFTKRTSSLFAPTSKPPSTAAPRAPLSNARSLTDLAARAHPPSILAPPPRTQGARYFSESSAMRVPLQAGAGGVPRGGVMARASMPYLSLPRDSAIGLPLPLPPPRGAPPEVPLPRVPASLVS
ncbi:MAG: hypothetical protein M1821_008240 [Bathelium mastoideum]|nr:MAG: hypothetical protein M1821_008240 [Bathelium mastoideum]